MEETNITKLLLDTILYNTVNDSTVRARDKQGKTALHKAARIKCSITADILLNEGAEVDGQDETGLSPLHVACMAGSKQVAKTLINWGANVNIRDKTGQTPAHMACAYGHPVVLKLLLESGAKVNTQNIEGWTPLHSACYARYEDVRLLEILLQNKANVHVKNSSGSTALHIAVTQSYGKFSKMLLQEGARVDVLNYDNESPYYLCTDSTVSDETEAVLSTHIVRLKTAGIPVNIDFHSDLKDILNIETKCHEELEKMKNTMIVDNFSLKNFISRFRNPWFLRNPDIFEKLKQNSSCPELVENFPVYAHILRNSFKQSKRRFSLLSSAFHSFDSEKRKHEGFKKLPDILKIEILDYLSNDDLKNLIFSG